MAHPLTIHSLSTAYGDRLRLTWEAGQTGGARDLRRYGDIPTALVGHFGPLRHFAIQVVGTLEHAYLESRGASADALLEQRFADPPAAVMVADALAVPSALRAAAERSDTPLFTTPLASARLIDHLLHYLQDNLAERTTLHGVFMAVMGIGVLLTGSSGVGKSELALELLSRGHRLIADDAPDFSRVAPDTLEGSCPALLRGFLEVRGLGVLNVGAMFGDNALKHRKHLRLILHLEHPDSEGALQADRLHGTRRTRSVLDVPVPEIVMPVAPGRNLAVLTEAAVRDHILRLHGYDAAQDFVLRQRQQLDTTRT